MIRHRRNRKGVAPRKRAMTMAFATSLAHGGDGSRRLAMAAAISVDDEAPQEAVTMQQLTTIFDSDHSSAGAMFDVKAKKSIIIRSVDINTVKNDNARVEIWYKKGSFKGYEMKEDAWTLWMNETIAGNGLDAPTHIPPELFSPMTVLADERRAFYVMFPDGPYIRYSKNGRQYYNTKDLVLYGNGAAKRKGFEGFVLYPRFFNGALHYETIQPIAPVESPTNIIQTPTSLSAAAPTAETRTVTTTFESSNTYAGNMFDMLARDNIEISSIAFNTWKRDNINVSLYTREGTYRGFDRDISQWTLVANVTVKGSGLGKPTYFPKGAFDPILIRRNKRLAFYITSDGPYLRAAKGTSEGKKSKANSDLVIFEGAGKQYPIDLHPFVPRVWNGIVEYQVIDIPTPAPTTATPTLRPTPKPTVSKFRLRLYWQNGYYWQESRREMWWCMECRNQCNSGDIIYIDHCDSSTRQRFTSVDDTIRPYNNPSLCLTTTGYSEANPLRLKPCDDVRRDQKFAGFKENERFELQPKGMTGRCVSQMHHPKKYERVYPEDCRKTRNHDTTYWITF
ncbi:hypothetical protein ACHAXR_008358 [Thalassiosira sp. AJA248-18]